VLLMVLTILVARKFPMQQKEFEIIKKEIARRKGEDHTETTEEEKNVCENVTGFAFDRLWNRDNAVRL
jgi:oligogalacturonide transporter